MDNLHITLLIYKTTQFSSKHIKVQIIRRKLRDIFSPFLTNCCDFSHFSLLLKTSCKSHEGNTFSLYLFSLKYVMYYNSIIVILTKCLIFSLIWMRWEVARRDWEASKIQNDENEEFFKLLYCCWFTVVCIFSLPLPPQLHPNSPPSLASTLPLGFVHVSFIVVPENPSPHCPLPTPLWLLLHCS